MEENLPSFGTKNRENRLCAQGEEGKHVSFFSFSRVLWQQVAGTLEARGVAFLHIINALLKDLANN